MQKGTIVFTALSLFALSGCAKVFVDETGCGGAGGSSASTSSSSSSSGVPLCSADADCEDGFGCTTDVCNIGNGQCAYEVIAGCVSCVEQVDCDDNNSCTEDRCSKEGSCVYSAFGNGSACLPPDMGTCVDGECCPLGMCVSGLLCVPCQ